jgi:glutamyl-tRNA(Gln) amidotransferase subunit E
LIHSDIKDYGLDPRQWRSLSKQLKADSSDALVVVWAPEADAPTAVRELFLRGQDALRGVPAETRQAFSDGTNGFERILPGPDRMYPDTDTPPIPISDSLVTEVRSGLPETPWDREERYTGLGLKPDAARQLARSSWANLYDALAPVSGHVAVRVANALNKRIPHWQRRSRNSSLPEMDRFAPMVRALESEEIRLEATEQMVDALLNAETISTKEVLARYRRCPDDLDVLEDRLKEIVAQVPAMSGRSLETLEHWGMGKLMRHFLGKLNPKSVAESLTEALSAALARSAS